MKSRLACLIAALICLQCALAQQTTVSAQPSTIVLWPEGAPGALGKKPQDIPTLTVFLPDPQKATGAAMIVCPGGGYGGLAGYEGADYARWLSEQGIAGFVLKYRLGSSGYRHPRMLQDAARALRLVRYRAAEWNLDTKRIGIIGSSAGGHLAATLMTHFDSGDPKAADPIDRVCCRPDLGVLCYPVITMSDATHKGSRDNLLGKNPSRKLIAALSNERHVTRGTPPCFIFHTAEDQAVPVKNSLDFAEALAREKVPFELHVYQHGRHGIALGNNHVYDPAHFHPWAAECQRWLKERGFGR